MFWLVLLAINVGLSALDALLRNRATKPAEFQAPTAEEGRAIPVIFGTVRVSPNVVWWGDVQTQAIRSGFIIRQTVGFKYWAAMQMALCHGQIDEVVAIAAQDTKDVPFSAGSPAMGPDGEDYIELSIDEEELFGGEDREGGLEGLIQLYRGGQGHEPNSYLSDKLGVTMPAYRGLCHAVLIGATSGRRFYFGTTPYIKPLAFVLRRIPDPFTEPGIANIGGDANPAFLIAETLINPTWGLGIAIERLDSVNFIAQAQTLFDEGFGLSMKLENIAQADAFISDVLRHIDAALYIDPATGLWTLKLARADYDPDDLPEFTPADVVEVIQHERGSWEETLNEIKVTYTGANFLDAVVQQQDSANFRTRGELASNTIAFPGIRVAAIARTVAMRELRAHALPWVKLHVVLNRRAWQLRLGSVFKLTWPALGISGTVFRVGAIDFGKLEDGKIDVTAVEDVFGVGYTAFDDPGDSLWEEPIGPPEPATAILIEMPYQFQHDDGIRVMVHAFRTDTVTSSFEVWVDDYATGYYKTRTIDGFTPTGKLMDPYGACTDALDEVGFTINYERDLEHLESTDEAGRGRGENLLLIDDEIMSWETITNNEDGTFTISNVLRGVYDTVPTAHLAYARVWFISAGGGVIKETAYDDNVHVDVKVLPTNLRGTVEIGDVTPVSIDTDSRAASPYPPGDMRVNGETCPTVITTDATVTWAHRIRTIPELIVIAQDAGDSTATPEGDYTLQALIDDIVVREFTGITGTSQVYTLAQRDADDPDPSKPVTLRLIPVNGDLEGTPHDKTFLMYSPTGPLVTRGFLFSRGLVVTGGFRP